MQHNIEVSEMEYDNILSGMQTFVTCKTLVETNSNIKIECGKAIPIFAGAGTVKFLSSAVIISLLDVRQGY